VSASSRFAVVGGLVGAAALALTVTIHHRNSPDALNRSVDSLLSGRLKVKYRNQKQSLDADATDQEGIWWMVLDGQPMPREDALANAGLKRADAEDTEHYTRMVDDQLAPAIPLQGYQLFRGEMALGAGSICERLACNVALLAQPGSPNLFVVISKT
jgi:hypothetical protein